MLKVVVGHSEDPNTKIAIEEVLEQCQQDLKGIVPQAGILFAAIDFEHEVILKEINRVFSGINLIGCTTDGEMSSVLGFQQDSLTLMLFSSDTIRIHAGVGYEARDRPFLAAEQAVNQANQKSGLAAKLCICLPASFIADSLTTNGELILQGLKQAFNSEVAIIGGTAGDQYRLQTTYQFFGTDVLTDSLPILTFSGDILFSYGTACGWKPIGLKKNCHKS